MTDHHTDVLEVLRRHQPSVDLLAEWSTADQEELLEELLAIQPARRRRRRLAAFGAVGAAAAVVPLALSVALPGHTPGGADDAAALERLAVVAGHQGVVLQPGQYLHTTGQTRQTHLAGYPLAPGYVLDGADEVVSSETWATTDDGVWVASADASGAPCLSHVAYVAVPAGQGSYEFASASDMARLPTDPDRLGGYIDSHPDGGNRGTVNRFAAVGDLLESGVASPALRAAALEVLAATPGLAVDTDADDAQGRPAIRVDLRGDVGTDALYLDPATSQLLEAAGPAQGGSYRTVTTSREATDRLPALPACPSP